MKRWSKTIRIPIFSYSDFDKENLNDIIENYMNFDGTEIKVGGVKLPYETEWNRLTAYTSGTEQSILKIQKALQTGYVDLKITYENYDYNEN